MKTTQISLEKRITKEQEESYFEIPFDVPENVCRIAVCYAYERYSEEETEDGIARREINIVDIALRDGEGNYIGASGAGRQEIYVSAWDSSAGYARTDTKAGRWAIIAGAYKIGDSGVKVSYTVTFTYRERMRLLGDTHLHTRASDGNLSASQLVQMAKAEGLDFIFVTDHNDYAQNSDLPHDRELCVLPGSEWTHYKGHAGMLGISRPLDSAFCVNSADEAAEKLTEARGKGAMLVLNHPFCPNCGWHFPLWTDKFDLIELVNGGTSEAANEKCLHWWHEQLCLGKRLPVIGGSDFHRIEPGHQPGQPTTAVYAMSKAPSDIAEALRKGHSYIVLWPKGPSIDVRADEASLGDTVPAGTPVQVIWEGLHGGDILRAYTDKGCEEWHCAPNQWKQTFCRSYDDALFVRFELLRGNKVILISNPLYFADQGSL